MQMLKERRGQVTPSIGIDQKNSQHGTYNKIHQTTRIFTDMTNTLKFTVSK